VTERAAYIARVRALARACCEAWLGQGDRSPVAGAA
jgi:glycyl-tRNA synthetase alpha subunit